MSRINQAFKTLKHAQTPTPRTAGEEFWDDFRARARYHPQSEPERGPRLLLVPRIATALASLVILASAIGMLTWLGPSAAHAETIQINSLEVVASHGGVLIMEDEPSHGTIVWIMDMENSEL